LQYIEGIGDGSIGMDCSVQYLRNDLYLISTTDFFYPSVDDPFIQGKIGAANVLSDLYAMGVMKCDNVLMILSASNIMTESQRDIVTRQMVLGFNETVSEAETYVRGGQTVFNAWPIIGGVAISCCSESEFINPNQGQIGDIIVLTKPLGTQVAVNLNEWIQDKESELFSRVKDMITPGEVYTAYRTAVKSMIRLNKTSAMLMHKYGAHGATDITGFGLIGHSTNLAKNQKIPVDIEIHTLPIIKKMALCSTKYKFRLLEGYSSETSGGLFIMLPSLEVAQNFCKELEEIDGAPAWIVGQVVEAQDKQQPKGFIKEGYQVIEVEL
jgi:selenide,water dikinase